MAFTITATTKGSYGFSQSDNTFTSTNTEVGNSASVTQISYNCNGGSYHLYLDCLNNAELNYDFGLISNIGTTLSTSYDVDTTNVKQSFKGIATSTTQTVDMGTVTGSNFFYIKYRKDDSVDTSPDRFQVTVRAVSLGYTITYQTNGGTSISPVSGATNLPNPLPTTNKSRNIFSGWYIDSSLITPAIAGAAISADTILYAKWVSSEKIDLKDSLSFREWIKTKLAGSYSLKLRAKANGCLDSDLTTLGNYNIYSISPILSNVTASTSNQTVIGQGGVEVTLTFTANEGYILPSSVSVNGATSTWTQSTGTLVLSNPTTNVIFNVNGVEIPTGKILRLTAENAAITYTTTSGQTSTRSSITANNVVSVDSVSYYYTQNLYCRLLNVNDEVVQSSLTLPYVPTIDNYKVVAHSEASGQCIDYYTQVTMADGTTKNLGDIEVGDMVLSIDFNTMKLVDRKVIYSGRNEPDYDQWYTNYYIRNEYSDGSIIKQSMRHRMYNLENQAYVHLDDVWQIDQHTYKLDGTNPTLVRRVFVEEPQHYARITLEDSNNYFANGLSTGDSECPTGIILDRPLSR